MSKVTQEFFDLAHNKAVLECTRKKPTQDGYNDLKKLRITSRPSPKDLLLLYGEIHNLLVEYNSALVPRKCHIAQPHGGYPSKYLKGVCDGVPITLPTDEKDLIFFIIEVLKDETVYQYPIRLDNLYLCGFRVLEPRDDILKKLWYSFGNVSILPKKFFLNSAPSGLPLAYFHIPSIQIHDGVLDKACNHFRNFRPVKKPEHDRLGCLLKDTIFFMLCEASRFFFGMKLTFKGVQNKMKNPAFLTHLMLDLIQDWGDVSRLGIHFWLALLEFEYGLADAHSHDPTFVDMFASFKVEANKYLKYKPLLKFKGPSDNWCLEALVGKSLYILSHDSEKCRMALMRHHGYKKPFLPMLKLE